MIISIADLQRSKIFYRVKSFHWSCRWFSHLSFYSNNDIYILKWSNVLFFWLSTLHISQVHCSCFLKVIESQLRKKMAEVKELFFETRDVFKQLETAKMQVATEIADHLSSIQTITNDLNTLNTSESSHALNTIQVSACAIKSTSAQNRLLHLLLLLQYSVCYNSLIMCDCSL